MSLARPRCSFKCRRCKSFARARPRDLFPQNLTPARLLVPFCPVSFRHIPVHSPSKTNCRGTAPALDSSWGRALSVRASFPFEQAARTSLPVFRIIPSGAVLCRRRLPDCCRLGVVFAFGRPCAAFCGLWVGGSTARLLWPSHAVSAGTGNGATLRSASTGTVGGGQKFYPVSSGHGPSRKAWEATFHKPRQISWRLSQESVAAWRDVYRFSYVRRSPVHQVERAHRLGTDITLNNVTSALFEKFHL